MKLLVPGSCHKLYKTVKTITTSVAHISDEDCFLNVLVATSYMNFILTDFYTFLAFQNITFQKLTESCRAVYQVQLSRAARHWRF